MFDLLTYSFTLIANCFTQSFCESHTLYRWKNLIWQSSDLVRFQVLKMSVHHPYQHVLCWMHATFKGTVHIVELFFLIFY